MRTPTTSIQAKLNTCKSLGLLLSLLLFSIAASGATRVWTGKGANQNWGTGGNWDNGTVPAPTDDALFVTNAAELVSGTVNNIVEANRSIQSLSYRNTNTFHTMQIDAGVTLTITGAVANAFFVGTGLESGGAAKVDAVITGGGSLLITNTSGVMNIRQGSQSTGAHRSTLDLWGLPSFTAYISRLLVAGDGVGSTTYAQQREAGTLSLAQTNFIYCASSSQGLGIADGSGNASSGTVYMGVSNVFYSDGGLFVGYRKSSGLLTFNSSWTGGFALFRDTSGAGRQGAWWIGNNATASSSVADNGNADFSTGTVDALVDLLLIGRSQTAGSNPGKAAGTLSFNDGVIDANDVIIGQQMADSCSAAGTLNMNNTARFIVNHDLHLGLHTNGTVNLPTGTINVGNAYPGGLLWVKRNVIDGGAAANVINISGGTFKVGGTVGSAAAPLQSLTLQSSPTLIFDLGTAPNPATPLWTVTSLTAYAPVTNTVLGLGLTPGQFTLIKYGAISGDDGSGFVLGSLPGRAVGYISNNTANLSIDLVITDVPAPVWNGDINGDWDIASTANWLTMVGNNHTPYYEPSVPGDPVRFDDSATGTTTVNLKTTLSPASITVSNSFKDYTFTGAGRLTGLARLIKDGSHSLTISNTSSNDFTGEILVKAGAIAISGSSDRLPTNAVITMAEEPTAAINLNSLNQTVGSISGGGSTGGNMSLGAATLTFQGDGGYYSGGISGAGSVAKAGSGAQTLAGASSYTGGTVINDGVLVAANISGSATGPGYVLVATTNAAFQFGDGGANGAIAPTVITNLGTVIFDRSDDFTLSKLITGSGGIRQNGTNVVTLATPNTYSGSTYINSGAFRVTHPDAVGDTNGVTEIRTDKTARLELAGNITLVEPLVVAQKQTVSGQTPAVLNVSGTNTIAGPMSGQQGGSDWTFTSDSGKLMVAGTWTNLATSGTRYLRFRGVGDGEWLTPIGNAATPSVVSSAFVKSDSGTWTLWATNTYNGNTIINGGLLLVNGAIVGSTNISVNGGALGGTGLVTAPVTVTNGGSITPAGTAVGTLTISNKVTFASGSIADFQVGPSGYDQVRGISTLTCGGTLKITLTGTLSGGEEFKLLSASAYTPNTFEAYDLPVLPAALTWDTSQLNVDGTLRVLGGANIRITGMGFGTDKNFQMGGTASWTGPYHVLATTNVANASSWVEVGTGTLTGGTFSFTDLNSTNFPLRFYRLETQ